MSAALHDAARRLWAGEMGVRGSALGAALAPAAAAYRLGVAARNRAYDAGLLPAWHAGIPVVSVGNIAVGGTGKTPFAHWLAVQLRARGRTPAILHGGYAADEPALHRRWAADIAVVVGRDRVHGAQQARAAGADVLVLDDGFQHRRLHRDLDIVLVAAERWQGASARLLPRGPWREPVTALRRATLVVVTRKTATEQAAQQVAADVAAVLGRADGPSMLRVFLRAGRWRHDGAAAAAPERAALLVAGLADPGLFVEGARQAGARVAGVLAFRDHHEYGSDDADRIRTAAGGAPIVTTEKDWTKLDRWLDARDVWLLAQDVVLEHGAAELETRIARMLA
jgi:tetraacyldisaccharide 4'-kinase